MHPALPTRSMEIQEAVSHLDEALNEHSARFVAYATTCYRSPFESSFYET